METSSKQFATWRVEREKEVVQLRRQNRRNTAHIQQLEALQAKQNAVLQVRVIRLRITWEGSDQSIIAA